MGEWRELRDEIQRERGRKQTHNWVFVYMVLQQGCENNTLSSLSHTQSYSVIETDVQQGTVGKGETKKREGKRGEQQMER